MINRRNVFLGTAGALAALAALRWSSSNAAPGAKFEIEKMYLGEVDIQKLDEAAFARIDN